MIMRGSRKGIKNPFRDAVNRDRDFLLALARAMQSIQRARTDKDFYDAVGVEFKSLGCETTLMMVNEDRSSLSIVYTSYPPSLIRKAEKLTKLSIKQSIPFSSNTMYGHVLEMGTAVFVESTADVVREIFSPSLNPHIEELLSLFNLKQGILAPLKVDDDVFGILKVNGEFLVEQDLPAIETFVGQLASGLQNLRLVRQLQDELEARKQVEEALRASETKFHALLDAVPDFLFVLTYDGDFVDYYTSHLDELLVVPSEFLGKNIRDVMPREFVDLFATTLKQLLQAGDSQLFEYSLNLPDGKRDFEAHIDRYQGNCVLCVARDVTERKQAEEAVRQAERRFKAMIENAPDGIALVGMDGRIKYASPSARKMFGYKGEDYSKETTWDSIHPDDIGSVIGVLAGLIENPSMIQTIQYRYKHEDASYHWVESTFSNQFGEPGIEAIVINFRDITERNQMEKVLDESEKYYRALIENAIDGIMVIDADARISFESPSIARLLGYGKAGLMWRSAFELIHPEDLPRINEAFVKGLEVPGFVHRGEYRLLHSNGDWRIFEIVTHYLMNDPAIMGIIINGRDITERKLAEDALRESENRFHSIVSEAADGIILTDETGHILEFNSALENISGYKREAVLGSYTWDFQFQIVPKELRTAEMYQKTKEIFLQYLETGRSQESHLSPDIVVPIERADGAQRFIQLRKFLVRTDMGWRLGSMARDVTEKRMAEQSLREQFTKLRSLYQMTSTLGQSTELTEVFDTALNSLHETIAVDRAAVLLSDADGVMRFKSWRGLSEAYRKIVEGHSPWKQDEQDPQPVLVPDVYSDASLFHFALALKAEGIGALGFIPLVHQGKLLGKFMIYYNTKHVFNEEEVQLAQTIAGHVAFAIFRQQAESALRASEEMYRILFEDNPSMYFTADENGIILSVNKFGIVQLGFNMEELVGKPIIDVFHPDDREQVRQQLETCLSKPEQTLQIEARKLNKNGKVMWIREAACAVRDIHGRLVILVTCDDITKRKQAEDELRRANESLETTHRELQQMFANEQILARTDSLTRLYNRRHFFELAIREFDAAIRYRRSLTIILFDVDGFKRANDTFGHALGDEILAQISNVVSVQVRGVDVVARFGGDEFIVMLPETNAEHAFSIADRIRQSIAETRIHTDKNSISVTISVGVAEIEHDPMDKTIEEIISRADKALYTAKQRGRNHTVIFTAN